MEKKQSKTLTLARETLRRLDEDELRPVAAGAPTNGVRCGFSEPSQCATCLCTL